MRVDKNMMVHRRKECGEIRSLLRVIGGLLKAFGPWSVGEKTHKGARSYEA